MVFIVIGILRGRDRENERWGIINKSAAGFRVWVGVCVCINMRLNTFHEHVPGNVFRI